MTKNQAHHLIGSASSVTLRTFKLCFTLGLWLVLASFIETSREPSLLEQVLADGQITMVSRNGPTTYYEDAEGYAGFEYVIGQAFADFLGVELNIVEEEDLGVILNTLSDEPKQFAGAGLTVTPRRELKVDFAQPYLSVTQKLIYRTGTPKPRKVEDLIGGKLTIISNSSHEENLATLKAQHPKLSWESRSDLEMVELLELVHDGTIDYTIVDSNAYEINKMMFPRARAAFDISTPDRLAWAFSKQKDQSLFLQARRFFSEPKTVDLITETLEIYYGHVHELNASDSIVFINRLDSRLPKWREKLENAAASVNLDWQLLAALSYQESHWNPKAVSPTGVKGFMMLTLPAAKDMGVKNRLDADESINGGARYFRSIYNRIPDRIEDPDRIWLALAAYNIGLGHLEDARILTEHHGGNPDKWADVQKNVLLLAKRKYYKSTKHGYARGWEAVEYVQNIRNFYNMIAWHERSREQQLAQNEQPSEYAEFSPVVSEAVKTLSTPSVEL